MEQDHVVRDQEPGAVLGTALHRQTHIVMDNRSSMVLGAAVVHAVVDEDSRSAADVGVGRGMGERMEQHIPPLLRHK
jgi:hypothetical protein